MLEVSISKKLSTFDLRLSFRIAECGVTVIFGPSGSGKSTLINCIAGLETPDSGRISCGNRDYFNSENSLNLPPEKRNLGYVFQDSRLFPHLQVRQNLAFGLRFHQKRDAAVSPTLADVADLLDITPLLDRAPSTLSGGERQRVSIGRALLCRPALLLMDEPLSSLDISLKQNLLQYLMRIPLRWHVPVLYVTHSPDEAMTLGTDMLLLHKGRLEAQGSVEATLRAAHERGVFPLFTLTSAGAAYETPCPA